MEPDPPLASSIPSLISAVEQGDHAAAEKLFAALYSELHRLAKRELARLGAPVTLGATTLLHQAYLEISAKDGTSFADRARFMGYAARVMRGLIIDYSRYRRTQKRGGQFEITSLGVEAENATNDRELLRTSEALNELAEVEPSLAEVVDLKFFSDGAGILSSRLVSCGTSAVHHAGSETRRGYLCRDLFQGTLEFAIANQEAPLRIP